MSYFRFRASACVVTYHGVLPDSYRATDPFLDNSLLTVAQFRSQLKLLKKRYNVIPPDHFRAWLGGSAELPDRAVLLTCDDGLFNNLSVMLPLLEEEGLSCLFFVTGQSGEETSSMLWYVELYLMMMNAAAGARGSESGFTRIPDIHADLSTRRADWLDLVTQLSRLDGAERMDWLAQAADCWGLRGEWKTRYLAEETLQQRFRVLQTSELKNLFGRGMAIGAHTLSHPVLSEQSSNSARTEIVNCRQKLEQCIQGCVWALAYPFGNDASVGMREYQFAMDAGYECAFNNTEGTLIPASRFSLPRVHITADMTPEVFEAHVSGFHEMLRHKSRAWQQKLERGVGALG